MYQLILISFVIIQTGAINYSDYCELDCVWDFGFYQRIAKHTFCVRSNEKCGPGENCHNFESLLMTDDIRHAIVVEHNVLRNKVAMGEETQGPQPKAANMNVLYWNEELASIAQCWANECHFEHDHCRRTEHLQVGQNMAQIQLSSAGLDVLTFIQFAIHGWYNEVAVYDPANVQYFDGSPEIGHYTQMVWGGVQYVGCGGALYTDGDWYTALFVCNYGGSPTGGNLFGAKVYEIGEPCSKCPSGTSCNKKYKGLCGIDYPVETHNSSAPGHDSVYNI